MPASFTSGAVAWMSLDAAGNPTLRGCIGGGGCTPSNPAGALNGTFRVAVTPDGRQLYAVSQNSNAASHLTLDATGAPTFANCSGSLTGCSPIAPSNALAGAFGLAIRPNGGDLYVASFNAHAVTRFSIAPPPPPPADPHADPTPPPPPPPPVVVQPAGIDNDKDGFFAGQDCNDGNAAIRPGAVEVKGNRLDENCDGLAEPFPTLTSGVASKWDVKGNSLTLTRCR